MKEEGTGTVGPKKVQERLDKAWQDPELRQEVTKVQEQMDQMVG